jgi:hypothetical protein
MRFQAMRVTTVSSRWSPTRTSTVPPGRSTAAKPAGDAPPSPATSATTRTGSVHGVGTPAAGVGGDRRRFRIAVEKALYKEGVLVGQWQTMPVPAQDLFQSKLGYGGTGFPWSINEARGIRYDYDPARFPVARMLCDTYTVVHGIHAPNGKELMDKMLEGFHKVFGNLDAVIAHADDPVYPGPDGALYGAA